MIINELLKLKFETAWEVMSISVPFSIAFLLVISFIYNYISPYLGIASPLTSRVFIQSYSVVHSLLSFIFLKFVISHRNESDDWSFNLQPGYLSLILCVCVVPILAVIGALQLNNGGSNNVTLAMLLLITVLVTVFVIFEKKIPNSAYPFSLLAISLSLLLMYSLRSNLLVGWDIQQEFRVFMVTKSIGLWAMSNSTSTYNAMLSITLLPTVISTLTRIPDLYIYKLVIPSLFSVIPVLGYIIARQYFNRAYSFLAAFFFVSQAQFMSQMPALNRQAIAFMFFALILISVLSKSFNRTQKHIIFFAASVLLIVSHYSTTYVTIGLILIVYLCSKIYTLIRYLLLRYSNMRLPALKNSISLWMLLFICTASVFWYGFYTQIAKDLGTLVLRLGYNLTKAATEDSKSDQAKYAIWGSGKLYSTKEITAYNDEITESYKKDKPWASYFPEEIVRQYPIFPMYAKNNPVHSPEIKKTSDVVFEISKKSIKTLMLLGLLAMIVDLFRKNKYSLGIEVLTLCSAAFIFLAATSFLPVLSVYYNFERLYQQTLLILSCTLIYGVLTITRSKHFVAKPILLGLVIIYFLNYSGFSNQLVGGAANLNLNNFGEEYDRFYTTLPEVAAASWFVKYSNQSSAISLDRYALLKFSALTNKESGFLTDLAPGSIPQYGYVYESRANKDTLMARTSFRNSSLGYTFPAQFVNDYKDQVYSSGQSSIYK